MTDFEKEIRQAARLLREETEARLRVPENPRIRRAAPHWGWYATPAAAVAGVVLGMSLTALTQRTEETLALVRDTIVRREVVRDTVFVEPQTQTRKAPVRDTLSPAPQPQQTKAVHEQSQEEPVRPVGQSVAEDGILYSLLVCE